MTTKSLKKSPNPKQVQTGKKVVNSTVKKPLPQTKKAVVSDSESDEGAFFKDSDDEMDWSEAESGEESFDEEDSEEGFGSSDDSEEEFVDDEEEFVDEDAEESEAEFDESADELVAEESDSESMELESKNLVESDLIVPSAVSHSTNPLLNYFWKLSDDDKAVRFEAVSGLIKHIESSQATFLSSISTSENKNSEKILSLYDSGSLSSTCCADLTYTIKRLLKGLASSRDRSRLGFMLALISVYHCFAHLLDAEVIFNWSLKLSSPEALGGSIKRREERLLFVARIFALGALFRSNLGNNLTLSSKKSAIDTLVSVGKKRSFLRESALEVIVCAVEKSEGTDLADYTMKKLASASSLLTETLTFAIIATSRFGLIIEKSQIGQKEFPSILSEFSDLSNLLSSSNEEPLLNLLQETPCFETRLHTVWALVLSSLNQKGCLSSPSFLRRVIEGMFLNSTGLVKRWTGLNLLKLVIESNKSGSFGFIFTPVILRMIKGSLGTLNVKSSAIAGKEVSAFNSAVIKVFRDLINRASDDAVEGSSEIAMDLILHLSKIPSGVAGKNLLEEIAADGDLTTKLYARLSSNNVIMLIDSISKEIYLDSSAQSQSPAAFQAPFDKLIALVKNEKLVKLENASIWIIHLSALMARMCIDSEPLNEELREIVKGRFCALLNELTDYKRFSGHNWIEEISKMYLDAASGSKTAQFSVNIDLPTSDALSNLKSIEKLLAKNKIEPERFSLAISSLKNYLSIMIFLDPIESIPVCAEFSECLKSHFSKSSKKDTTSSLEVVMPTMVDILMTFLSKSSQLSRKMCDDIFRNIIPFLSVESMDILFKVLKTVGSDVNSIFEEVDDEISAEDESESEVEDIGDAEVESLEVIDRAINGNQSESELSDADDEQMLAFDDKLVEIFREKRKALGGASSKAAQVKETKKSIIQFKFKILELINLAFKSGDLPVSTRISSITGLIEVLSANLNLNGSSSNAEQKQLFTKLESFFAEAFGRPPRNPTKEDGLAAESLIFSLIDRICSGEKLINHAAVLPRVAQCTWYLIKIGRALELDESRIKTKFEELIKHAVSPDEDRFRVFRSFIFTWSNWDLHFIAPSLSSMPNELNSLLGIGAIRPYQRSQLLEFLTSLLKRAHSFKETGSAIKLLESFSKNISIRYLPTISDDLKKMNVDFFKDDLKFILFCSKKHCELEPESGSTAWSAITNSGIANMEEFWKSQPSPSNAVKSFLGQLKSSKK